MSEYNDAVKLGQREHRACLVRGYYPYLPVLDEILPPDTIPVSKSLGLVQIPAEFIVGTKNRGRTTAFARNFMPLLAEKTEFAIKWQRLCNAQKNEGIRDPIKVYEYMNRFYVEEGNKRVSVLKFFGAVNIDAYVTRIMPEKTNDRAVRVYYEFVDFYRVSKINFIEFSHEGRYARFCKLLGKAPDEAWTDEERSALLTFYHYFRQAYNNCGGLSLRCTAGDALLVYLTVFDYKDSCNKTPAQLKKELLKIWSDVTLQQEPELVDLKLDERGEKKAGILPTMRTTSKKPLKVAFLNAKTPQTSGWTYGHELGRRHVEKVFGEQIITTAYNNVTEQNHESVLEQAIADGNTVLFTTTPQLMAASFRVAVNHPEVTVLNCSLTTSYRHVRTYYSRIYEAKFILGAIAGALAKNDRIGYICDYPIHGMIAGINAFALGAQMVNPRAKVYLEWSTTIGLQASIDRLRAMDISLISFQDLVRLDSDERFFFGLAEMHSDGQTNLAMPIWHWGVYYEKLIRRILDRTFKEDGEETRRAVSYYWGISEGVVDVILSDHLPAGTKRLAENLRAALTSHVFRIFANSFVTQEGNIFKGAGDTAITPAQIIHMDDLAENIIGSIPAFDELSEESRPVVEVAGVKKATAAKKSQESSS